MASHTVLRMMGQNRTTLLSTRWSGRFSRLLRLCQHLWSKGTVANQKQPPPLLCGGFYGHREPSKKTKSYILLSSNQHSRAPLSPPGQLESTQNQRESLSEALTSAQRNILSFLPSLRPRITQVARSPDGVPTPFCVVTPEYVCFGK